MAVSAISDTMTRDCFFQIRSNLCCQIEDDVTDNDKKPERLWKVAPFVEMVRKGCLSLERPKLILRWWANNSVFWPLPCEEIRSIQTKSSGTEELRSSQQGQIDLWFQDLQGQTRLQPWCVGQLSFDASGDVSHSAHCCTLTAGFRLSHWWKNCNVYFCIEVARNCFHNFHVWRHNMPSTS